MRKMNFILIQIKINIIKDDKNIDKIKNLNIFYNSD